MKHIAHRLPGGKVGSEIKFKEVGEDEPHCLEAIQGERWDLRSYLGK